MVHGSHCGHASMKEGGHFTQLAETLMRGKHSPWQLGEEEKPRALGILMPVACQIGLATGFRAGSLTQTC